MAAYRGGCLCGAVRFALDGPIEVVNCCHCARCRKRTGSAFATIVHARYSDFEFVSGQHRIKIFEPNDWSRRRFCGDCGSPMPGWDEEDNEIGIPAGLFDEGFDVPPGLHIMTAFKAEWFEITDKVVQHKEFPDDW